MDASPDGFPGGWLLPTGGAHVWAVELMVRHAGQARCHAHARWSRRLAFGLLVASAVAGVLLLVVSVLGAHQVPGPWPAVSALLLVCACACIPAALALFGRSTRPVSTATVSRAGVRVLGGVGRLPAAALLSADPDLRALVSAHLTRRRISGAALEASMVLAGEGFFGSVDDVLDTGSVLTR